MENKSKIYGELVNILRVAHNNVNYETLNNLATLVQNISTYVRKVEESRQLECNLKNEAYYFIIENNLLDEFKFYLERTRTNMK